MSFAIICHFQLISSRNEVPFSLHKYNLVMWRRLIRELRNRSMQGCCHYCPPTKLWEGNVVFSCVCSQGGSHVTIINAVLEITVQGFLHVGPQVPPALAIPLLVASGGHHWRPAKACSLQNPPPFGGADIWWLLKQVRWSQAGCTHPTGMLSCYN